MNELNIISDNAKVRNNVSFLLFKLKKISFQLVKK